MRLLNKIFIGLGILAIGFFLLCLRPVPIVPESECLVVTGIVDRITEGGIKDVVIRLKENRTVYYINRGLEQGLNLDKLQADLIGKEVIMKYPKYWTPLDLKESIRHISKVEAGGQVIFNECPS